MPCRYQQDEWLQIGGLEKRGKSLLFTSMERIRLLRHVIEASEAEGGCGLGSLDDLCMRGIFASVVPVGGSHAQCSARASSAPDDRRCLRGSCLADSASRRLMLGSLWYCG